MTNDRGIHDFALWLLVSDALLQFPWIKHAFCSFSHANLCEPHALDYTAAYSTGLTLSVVASSVALWMVGRRSYSKSLVVYPAVARSLSAVFQIAHCTVMRHEREFGMFAAFLTAVTFMPSYAKYLLQLSAYTDSYIHNYNSKSTLVSPDGTHSEAEERLSDRGAETAWKRQALASHACNPVWVWSLLLLVTPSMVPSATVTAALASMVVVVTLGLAASCFGSVQYAAAFVNGRVNHHQTQAYTVNPLVDQSDTDSDIDLDLHLEEEPAEYEAAEEAKDTVDSKLPYLGTAKFTDALLEYLERSLAFTMARDVLGVGFVYCLFGYFVKHPGWSGWTVLPVCTVIVAMVFSSIEYKLKARADPFAYVARPKAEQVLLVVAALEIYFSFLPGSDYHVVPLLAATIGVMAMSTVETNSNTGYPYTRLPESALLRFDYLACLAMHAGWILALCAALLWGWLSSMSPACLALWPHGLGLLHAQRFGMLPVKS